MRTNSYLVRISCLSGAFALCYCSEPPLALFTAASFCVLARRWAVLPNLLYTFPCFICL